MGHAAAVAACILTSFIVHMFAPPANADILEAPCTKQSSSSVEMYQMHVEANVRNRFAHTTVTAKVMNCGTGAKETNFTMVLPKAAFISGFVMEVNGKNYTAYVKEKDQAKQAYREAISSGFGAAHVAVSVRDSNEITVSVNVEPRTKAAFYLTYEELLTRRNGQYKVVINLRPGQLVPDLSVMVNIEESRKITNLGTPQLISGDGITPPQPHDNFMPFRKTLGDTTAKVGFSPNIEKQKELAHNLFTLSTLEDKGLACQFVVAYDVERDPKGGEVLVRDGYFVLFFAPSNLKRLPKLVVFVLDTSYSMTSRGKIYDLKNAMHVILDDLQPDDAFHLVEFNTDTKVWVLENSPRSIKYTTDNITALMANYQQHNAYTGNPENIRKAKAAVSLLKPTGWTDVNKALRIGIRLVQLSKTLSTVGTSRQPMIIFLSDGDPTVGEKSTTKILKEITRFNTGLGKTPIFTLSFGESANRTFLKTLALSNSAYTRHIYEAGDASLQLQNFYTEISSPLLANIVFKYHSSSNNLTETKFPMHFRGAELLMAGRYDPNAHNGMLQVNAWDGEDELSFFPTVHQSTSSIERLWAYLAVKQLLEKKDNPELHQEELKQKAIELSLKYSFVTSVTSLVVVKPSGPDHIDITDLNEPLPTEEQERDDTMGGNRPQPSHNNVGDSYLTVALETGPLGEVDFAAPPMFLSDLKDNGWLNLPVGRYKLGANETFKQAGTCSNSLLNSQGDCILLHLCLDDSMLLRVDDYLDHFCVVKNQYAGICCPNGWLKTN